MSRIILLMIAVFCLNQYTAAKNKILVAGSGNGNIILIDKESGSVEWSHKLEKGQECNSVAMTPDGNIIYSHRTGARIVDWNHKLIWEYTVLPNQELQSVTLLNKGGYLLGICGTPAQFIEIDNKGKEVNRVELDLEIKHPHSQFRQIRQLKNQNYLIPVLSKKKIVEVNPQGKKVSEHAIEGGPFSSLELKNGNLIIPCGDGHFFIEINKKTGEVIRRVNSDDLNDVSLLFVAQIDQLKNKNLLISNWNGHARGEINNAPQLFELTPNNEVVWQLSEDTDTGKISAFYCLTKSQTAQFQKHQANIQ